MGAWEAVIGLEVHVQLGTRTKIFCPCPTDFGAEPNAHVCPVCLGMPGVLPVLNGEVVRLAVRAALALGCEVNERSQFARKNYFYPDLPKGYQISQFDQPLATGGSLSFEVDGKTRTTRIERLHLEEDAGKSTHLAGRATSLVDFNRAGVPLAEIVGHHDLRTADEASAYLRELRNLVRWVGAGDGNMEEGSFRCDANVSVRPVGSETLGTRAEVKNMNSFRHVRQALVHEVERQSSLLEQGGRVVQETRLWDPERGVTAPMRSKEDAHDYRYFPDPDLPPLRVPEALVAEQRGLLPELPAAKRTRYQAELGLRAYDSTVLTSDRETAEYFEASVAAGAPAKATANWVMGEVLAASGRAGVAPTDLAVTPARLAALIGLVDAGRLGRPAAKEVFLAVLDGGEEPEDALARLGLEQVSDGDEIGEQVRAVLAAHPGEVAEYRAGKAKLIGFFMGKVMRAMGGKGDPAVIKAALKQELGA